MHTSYSGFQKLHMHIQTLTSIRKCRATQARQPLLLTQISLYGNLEGLSDLFLHFSAGCRVIIIN